MWANVVEALNERAKCQHRHHEISAKIFRIKRDFEDRQIDVDRFDDERMELNGELRSIESAMETLDAWVAEQRAPAIEQERRHQLAMAESERQIAEHRAATARDNLEVQRLAIAAKEKANADQLKIAEARLAAEKEKTTRSEQSAGVKQLKELLKGLVEAVLAENALQPMSNNALRVLGVVAEVRRALPGFVEKIEQGS